MVRLFYTKININNSFVTPCVNNYYDENLYNKPVFFYMFYYFFNLQG